jgi:putative transcriptional regulator
VAKKTSVTNNIRALRFAADEMSQQTLATKVEMTRQSINAIEAGKYSPSLECAFKIALVFKVELGQVFGFEVDGLE